ncbi:MAG: hypothetical protein R8M11_06005 [Gallionella sp.]
MKSLIVLVLALIAPTLCVADEYTLVDDLTACKWRDGSKISQEECDDLKDKIIVMSERREHIQEQLKAPDTQSWQHNIAKMQFSELDEYTKDLMERSYKINKKHPELYGLVENRKVADLRMTLPIMPDDRTPQEIEIERIIAAKKLTCGSDYKRLYIGMKEDRMIVCYGAYFESKVIGKDGIVAIYQTMYDWVEVRDGIVVNYTRRRD